MRKKPIIRTALILCSFFLSYNSTSAQVLIGTPSTVFSGTMNLDVEATDATRTVIQKADGKMGLGTTSPSTLLHINSASSPAVRIVDGTQGAGKVLTSDALGNVTWQTPVTAYWGLTGNAGTTPPTQVGTAVGATNYLGTTDAKNLAIGTNATTRMIFDQKGNAFGGNYNIMASDSNTLVWGGSNRAYGHNSLVVGFQNVDSSKFSTVLGNGNSLGPGTTFQTNRGVILSGGSNVVTAGNSYNSIINGSQVSVYGDCYESILSGYQSIISSSQKCFTVGQWNILTNATYSSVLGIGNTALSIYALLHGNGNQVKAGSDYGIALGQSNTVEAGHLNSMAIGKDVTTTATNQLAANYSGGYKFFSTSGVTSATTAKAVILPNGNVGIGTEAPTNKVEIKSAAANTSGLTLTNLTSVSPVTSGNLSNLAVDANGVVVTAASMLTAFKTFAVDASTPTNSEVTIGSFKIRLNVTSCTGSSVTPLEFKSTTGANNIGVVHHISASSQSGAGAISTTFPSTITTTYATLAGAGGAQPSLNCVNDGAASLIFISYTDKTFYRLTYSISDGDGLGVGTVGYIFVEYQKQ